MRSQKERREEGERKKKEEKERMWALFTEIWLERPHYSEVSWAWLGKEMLSIYFHHILPKGKYKEAKFDKDNIILLTWDEHGCVENNPTRFAEVNKRRGQLREKYG